MPGMPVSRGHPNSAGPVAAQRAGAGRAMSGQPPGPPPLRHPHWQRVAQRVIVLVLGALVVALAALLAGAVLLGLQFVRLDRNHLGGGPSAPFFVGTAWHLDEELT